MLPEIPQGEWSRAYAFRHGGRELVVRFNPLAGAFDPDVVAQRYASDHIPMPRLLEVGDVDGGCYAISERAFGDFLEDLPPHRMQATLPSILDTLEALRRADTSQTTGFGPWTKNGNGMFQTWREYLLELEVGTPTEHLSTWRDGLRLSQLGESTFLAGTAELERLSRGCPDQRNLVHSDLINRNAFVSDGRIKALIDWQCAMYGDHLYDLAWLLFWAPWHPGLSAVDMRSPALERWAATGIDLTNADTRLRCYELHIGLRHLVYNAWRRDIKNLDATARRTLELLG